MKELLIQALDNAFEKIKVLAPQTKDKMHSIDLDLNISPTELVRYITNNNISDNAEFDWVGGTITWYTEIPTTDLENLDYIRYNFCVLAWQEVKCLLIKEGYQQVKYVDDTFTHWIDFATQRNPIVYDFYMYKDWDSLLHFYSLAFRAPNNKLNTTLIKKMDTSKIKVYYVLTTEFGSPINPDTIKEWQTQDSLSGHAKLFVETAISKGNVYNSFEEFMYDLNYAGIEFLDFYYFCTDKI